MKISTVYGREVISTAGKRGYILSVHTEGAKLIGFTCADQNEREFGLDIGNVLKFGDSILFRDESAPPIAAPRLRLGRAAYDEKGNWLGLAEDFTFSGNRLQKARIGKKNYPAEGLVFGDVLIVKSGRKLRYDVEKNGKILLKKGTPLTAEAMETARKEGEYVQASLKSL